MIFEKNSGHILCYSKGELGQKCSALLHYKQLHLKTWLFMGSKFFTWGINFSDNHLRWVWSFQTSQEFFKGVLGSALAAMIWMEKRMANMEEWVDMSTVAYMTGELAL